MPCVYAMFSASISPLIIRLSCYRHAPKDKRSRRPLAHMPRCYNLPSVQTNSSDLGDSHKWPWSVLWGGGGSRPLDPPPSPTRDKVFNTQYTFSSEQMISADEHMRILLSQWRTPMVPSQCTAGLLAKQALWVSAADA